MKKILSVLCLCWAGWWSAQPGYADDSSNRAETNVRVCNESESDEAYVAIRFFENNEWHAQGWWKVEKNKCREIGYFPSEQAIYALATSSADYPGWYEYRPSEMIAEGCVNPETAFDYAETADGRCEARETIPADAPAAEKANFGKLVDAGYRGSAQFRITSTFIALFHSPSTGEVGVSKNEKSAEAESVAKAQCGKPDCESVAVIRDACLAFAIEDKLGANYGWGEDSKPEKAEEVAVKYCKEGAREPELCRVILSECP